MISRETACSSIECTTDGISTAIEASAILNPPFSTNSPPRGGWFLAYFHGRGILESHLIGKRCVGSLSIGDIHARTMTRYSHILYARGEVSRLTQPHHQLTGVPRRPGPYSSSKRLPAVQSSSAGAVRLRPPLTEALVPLAVLKIPPLTEEKTPLAIFNCPPLTEATPPLVVFPCPPLTEAKSPLISFKSPTTNPPMLGLCAQRPSCRAPHEGRWAHNPLLCSVRSKTVRSLTPKPSNVCRDRRTGCGWPWTPSPN
jgi:hypothetical protein